MNDGCFGFDGYDNLVSYPDFTDAVIDEVDIDDLAEYIADEKDDLGNGELEDIIDEYNATHEDD